MLLRLGILLRVPRKVVGDGVIFPGSVPDADDTSGALVAFACLNWRDL